MTRSVLFWIGFWMIVMIVVVIVVHVHSLYVNTNAGEISYPLSRQKDVQDIAWEMMHELGWESISGSSMLHPGERVQRGIYRAVDGNGKAVTFTFDGSSWTRQGWVKISVNEGSEYSLKEITANLGRRLDFIGISVPELSPGYFVPLAVLVFTFLVAFYLGTVILPERGTVSYPWYRREAVRGRVEEMIQDMGWRPVSGEDIDPGTMRESEVTLRAMDGRGMPVTFDFSAAGPPLRRSMQISVEEGAEFSRKEVTMELGRRLGVKKYPPLRPREDQSPREKE